ncbi:MAG: MBL fold metallo-hydrolase [Nannocystaceae bacterium]
MRTAGTEEVAEGLTRVALRTPTLPPATTTNTLVVGRRRLAVIEPATPDEGEQRALEELLSARVDAGAEVVALLLTHHHRDHIGHAEALRRRFGAPILCHEQTALRIPFAADRTLDDGDTLDLGDGFALDAIFTPGHAPGHLVFRERASAIFHVGDLVAGEGTILIDPEDDGDMGLYLESLRRVADLAPTALVPAHGPVLRDPQAILRRYVDHRLAREARVVQALAAGADTFDAVLAAAYEDTPRWLWPLAARSLEAHLQKLERDGRLPPDRPRRDAG